MLGGCQGECTEDRTLWLAGLRNLVYAACWWLKVLITPPSSHIPEKGKQIVKWGTNDQLYWGLSSSSYLGKDGVDLKPNGTFYSLSC